MILACLWFPFSYMEGREESLGSWWGHSRSRNQQQGSPWHQGLPSHEASQDLQEHKEILAAPPELWHTMGAIPGRKSSSLLPAGEQGSSPEPWWGEQQHSAASPWAGRGHCLAVWGVPVTSHTPSGCLSLQTCQPDPLPLLIPLPFPVPSLLQTQVISEGTAHGSRGHSRWWTSVTSRPRNPNQVIRHKRGRMETSTELSLRNSWFSLSRQCC